MYNIIRFWNENRRKIIVSIIAIVFIFATIRILNQIGINSKKARANSIYQLTEEEKNLPTESILGMGSTSINTTKQNVNVIEQFIEKCNKKDITGAYNMLTDNCKEVLFPSIENFKTGYYDVIFSTTKIVDMELFTSNGNLYTYIVKFNDDALSTGKIENNKVYQDYITIDYTGENGKLNVNSFIYKRDINKTVEKDGIKITILNQQIYKDNEKYKIKIENNTQKRILIDTKKKGKSIYLVDSNNITYNSNIAEISSVLCEVPEEFYRTYEIKFYKKYTAMKESKEVVFSDIVADYEQYKQKPNEVGERVWMNVSI